MLFRIFKMIAPSGFLAALECTKFVFGRDSASAPRRGILQRSPRPRSWFKGDLLLRGRGGKREEEGREGREGERTARGGRGGKGGTAP